MGLMYKCERCGEIFNHHDAYEYKNRYDVKRNRCNLHSVSRLTDGLNHMYDLCPKCNDVLNDIIQHDFLVVDQKHDDKYRLRESRNTLAEMQYNYDRIAAAIMDCEEYSSIGNIYMEYNEDNIRMINERNRKHIIDRYKRAVERGDMFKGLSMFLGFVIISMLLVLIVTYF